MEIVGYRNAQKVTELARKGKLNSYRDENATLNQMAYIMLQYMAFSSIDWEDEEAKKHHPARCYWRGWDAMALDLGLTLPSPKQAKAILDGDLDHDETIGRRTRSAKNRLSQTARWLRERGLIKQLVPANSFMGRNATWLLNLGDPEENDEVETFARWKLGLPAFSDYAMDDHES